VKHYVIRAIPLCEGERDMSQWTYRWNPGKKTRTACYTWYIEGSDPLTLVDTGAEIENFTNPDYPMKKIMTLEEGLGQYGLKPEEIRQIIVTHLHFDHIALAGRFPNATFLVQKTELEFAQNPHIFCAVDYNQDYIRDIDFKLIEGDREILPGLNVMMTSGHTPGGQSVVVHTPRGKAVIAGMCSQLSTFEQTSVMKMRGLEVAVCGIHTDCRVAYDSALKIKKEADIIVPVHEPLFISQQMIGSD